MLKHVKDVNASCVNASCCRYMERPIILINPSLEAIHSMASSSRKVRL